MMTPQQSRALASIMGRMPPAQRKQVQLDILSGMDERKAVMKGLGQQADVFEAIKRNSIELKELFPKNVRPLENG